MLRSTTTTPTRSVHHHRQGPHAGGKYASRVWQNYTPRWLNSFDTISSSTAPTCFPSVCFSWPPGLLSILGYCASGSGCARRLTTFSPSAWRSAPSPLRQTLRPVHGVPDLGPRVLCALPGSAATRRSPIVRRPDLSRRRVAFSGFLVAAVCGINEGLRAVLARQWTRLASLVAAFLPLLALGSLLYLHYATQGAAGAVESPGNPHRLRSTRYRWPPHCGIPGELLHFVTLFGSVRSAGLQRMLLIMSFRRLHHARWRTFPDVRGGKETILAACRAAVGPLARQRRLRTSTLSVPTAAATAGFHSCSCPWLSPRRIDQVAPIRRRDPRLSSSCWLPICWCERDSASRYGQEFTLRQRDYELGQAHLAKHMEPGDAIVTTRVTYSYFVHAKGGGEYPYDGYGSLPYLGDFRRSLRLSIRRSNGITPGCHFAMTWRLSSAETLSR